MAKFNQMVETIDESGLPVDDAEVTEVQEEAVDTSTRSYSDTPQFDRSELMIPKLRLAQGLTQEVAEGNAKMGQWLLQGFDPEDDVIVVPTLFTRTRALREGEERELVCSSPDAKYGDGKYGRGSQANPTGLCDEDHCPAAKWGAKNPKTGKSSPPPCVFSYEYVVWSDTHKTVATLAFSKSAINAAKYLNSFIQTKGLGKFAVRLSSKQEKGKGTYAVPLVTLVKMPESAQEEMPMLGPGR